MKFLDLHDDPGVLLLLQELRRLAGEAVAPVEPDGDAPEHPEEPAERTHRDGQQLLRSAVGTVSCSFVSGEKRARRLGARTIFCARITFFVSF